MSSQDWTLELSRRLIYYSVVAANNCDWTVTSRTSLFMLDRFYGELLHMLESFASLRCRPTFDASKASYDDMIRALEFNFHRRDGE